MQHSDNLVVVGAPNSIIQGASSDVDPIPLTLFLNFIIVLPDVKNYSSRVHQSPNRK